MKTLTTVINSISHFFNYVAGGLFVFLMFLVTLNVILRSFFSSPLLGAFEYAGYGTALAISFSIALCTLRDGHIAITFIADKFLPEKFNKALVTLINILSAAFFTFVGRQLFLYAADMAAKGVLSATTRTAYYPIIYVVSMCFFFMTVVLIYRVIATYVKVKEADKV